MAAAAPPDILLDIRDLATEFHTAWGPVRAVDGVSLAVRKGRTLGIVGESGCGKSVTSLSVMGLLTRGAGRVVAGEVVLEGRDLLRLDEEAMRRVRGNRIGMIFQEPMTSLNPVMTIGDQIGEGLVFHRGVSRRAALDRAVALLEQVGFPAARRRLGDYPHQLSGGMRQRVMIAIALACDPAVLLADEPTTALDVTIQAQILELLRRLQDERHMGIVLITHDLGVVAEMAHDIAIMYAGRVVERGTATAIFEDAQHPYTIGLLGSIARLDVTQDRLDTIPGQVPGPAAVFRGCRFSDRCPFSDAHCRAAEPPLSSGTDGHAVACWKAPI